MSDPRTPTQIEAEIAQDLATTDTGSPRPEVLGAAGSLLAMAVVLVVWRVSRTH